MKLAMILPNAQDGTSLARAAMPMAMLSRQHPELRLIHGAGDGTEWSWNRIAECDAVFLQRPFSDNHLKVAEMVKKMRIPLWIDYDDDLLCVPRSNPAHRVFAQPSILSNVRKAMRAATVLTVSTTELASRVDRKDVTVIPNAFNDYMMSCSSQPRNKTISWRGSVTHQEDLYTVILQMAQLASEHTDWRWRFFGDVPWDVYSAIPQSQMEVGPEFNVQEPLKWLDLMTDEAPYIHIAPLADNQFNRSKSSIVWFEATAAGAMVVAPDLPEFQRSGIRNYKDGPGFKVVMETIMREFDKRIHPNVVSSRLEMQSRGLLLSETNKLRWRIINDLCKAPTAEAIC